MSVVPPMTLEEIERTISIMNQTNMVQNELPLRLVRQFDAIKKRLSKLETKEEADSE